MIFPSGDILIRIHISLRSIYNCSMEKLAEKRRFSSLFGSVLKMAVCRRAGTRPKSRHPLPNLLWERLLDDPDRQIVRLTNQRFTEVGRQESPQAMQRLTTDHHGATLLRPRRFEHMQDDVLGMDRGRHLRLHGIRRDAGLVEKTLSAGEDRFGGLPHRLEPASLLGVDTRLLLRFLL